MTEYARGTILHGKYRVERVLGEGGMGIVLLATHLKLERRVAVKVLRPAAKSRPQVVERFAREARAAARLRNEHVVRVLDVDETDGGDPFLVMEHLVGVDLETRLKTDGALSAEVASDYLLQVCEGVAEAHAMGIVHRDLKPANLFVTKGSDGADLVKVLDFGIAKAGADLAVTAADSVLGSPIYMSPEQLQSAANVGPSSDIWSLGVVLYQLVSAELPFEATNIPELVTKIGSGAPRSLRDLRPTLPEPIFDIVEQCLEKSPDDRFRSVVELARALAGIASVPSAADRVSRVMRAAAVRAAEPSSRHELPPAERVTAVLTAAEAEAAPPAPKKPADSRRFLIAGALLVAAVAAIFFATRAPAKARVATPALTIDDAGVGFDDLVFAPELERVIVPGGETGRVLLVDPRTRGAETIEGFTHLPPAHGGHTQGVTSAAPAGTFVAAIDRSARTVSLIDPAAKKIVASHVLSGIPDYVRFEPSSQTLWVTEPDSERIEIFELDPKKAELPEPESIEVPGGPEFIAFDATRAYTNLWKGATMAIELRTRKPKTTFPNGCEGSRTLAFDPARALLFVACTEGAVTVIDVSHGYGILGRFAYQAGIDALAFDASRSVLYAPSGAAGKMAALTIDRDGVPHLAFEVVTERGATCAAVDGKGAVWLCDPSHGRILVADTSR
jgi:serine/threonine-protein kinase